MECSSDRSLCGPCKGRRLLVHDSPFTCIKAYHNLTSYLEQELIKTWAGWCCEITPSWNCLSQSECRDAVQLMMQNCTISTLIIHFPALWLAVVSWFSQSQYGYFSMAIHCLNPCTLRDRWPFYKGRARLWLLPYSHWWESSYSDKWLRGNYLGE